MSNRTVSPLGRVHARLRRSGDFEAMQEVAKLLGRNSRERWEMRCRLREAAKSDVQFDHDVEREEEIGL